MKITDFNVPDLDIFARISDKQLLHYCEPVKEGLFIAESPNVILRALAAGYQPVSLLTEEKNHHSPDESKVIQFFTAENLPIFEAPLSVISKLTGYPMTRGMLSAMRRKTLPSVREICKGTSRIAVLENVMNPTNIGAIIRSAAALGIDALIFSPGCCDPLYRRAIRVSMGTIFQIPWTVSDYWPMIDELRVLGFKSAAMALKDDTLAIDDPTLHTAEKLAVLLGTEGEGLSDETIDACDFTVKIPMAHGVDSLNVAAASAVAFWELCRHS